MALARAAGVALAVLIATGSTAAAGGESCFARASRLAQVDADVLLAMSYVESRWQPEITNGSNRNGTEDVCLMQVNSRHFDRLAAIGISRDQLLGNWCVCLLTGAQILREMMEATGHDLWTAVAAYNAGPNNVAGGRRYAGAVRETLTAIRTIRQRRAAGTTAGLLPEAPVPTAGADPRLDALAAQLKPGAKGGARWPIDGRGRR
ncbi:soluble lytic murein transglycosylase-like protein [Inquilinus ginsengisoli]|uniref:Soluble lytic murein transglycosylase-like protein n=1 Tax=Inquilinus ginsengisoli TaxID=363840 RepID=A0ABU1JYT6_9PROT|nr:lytic transglycosylase domain-containing protein [Inquilinus ginsengisoli]MDR6293791.1 soluble lytic murein transglycosylase-like protein [Inquilinus ginsengisoli]